MAARKIYTVRGSSDGIVGVFGSLAAAHNEAVGYLSEYKGIHIWAESGNMDPTRRNAGLAAKASSIIQYGCVNYDIDAIIQVWRLA